jgi:hypothetical protein
MVDPEKYIAKFQNLLLKTMKPEFQMNENTSKHERNPRK